MLEYMTTMNLAALTLKEEELTESKYKAMAMMQLQGEITCPKDALPQLMCDEVSEEPDGTIRVWWD